jgi:hypothetical protein
MHPTLARFLNFDTALDTFSRADQGQPLDEDERALVRASQRAPEALRKIRRAQGPKPSDDSQRAMLFLALHAAAERIREDATLQPGLDAARTALIAAGRSHEGVDALLAVMLSEEAFGYDDDAENFDRAFFHETLDTLPSLLGLSKEHLAATRAAFLLGFAGSERKAAERVWDILLKTAWEDGVEPIHPEHLADAFERLSSPAEQKLLKPLLQRLADAGVIGPLRLERLISMLQML